MRNDQIAPDESIQTCRKMLAQMSEWYLLDWAIIGDARADIGKLSPGYPGHKSKLFDFIRETGQVLGEEGFRAPDSVLQTLVDVAVNNGYDRDDISDTMDAYFTRGYAEGLAERLAKRRGNK